MLYAVFLLEFSMGAKLLPTGGTAMYALMALAGDVGCSSGPTVVGMVASHFEGDLKKGLAAAMVFPVVILVGFLFQPDNDSAAAS